MEGVALTHIPITDNGWHPGSHWEVLQYNPNPLIEQIIEGSLHLALLETRLRQRKTSSNFSKGLIAKYLQLNLVYMIGDN